MLGTYQGSPVDALMGNAKLMLFMSYYYAVLLSSAYIYCIYDVMHVQSVYTYILQHLRDSSVYLIVFVQNLIVYNGIANRLIKPCILISHRIAHKSHSIALKSHSVSL